MITEDDTIEFNETISIYEEQIKEVTKLDTIIYIYDKSDNTLYSNTFNSRLNLNFKSNSIIFEA